MKRQLIALVALTLFMVAGRDVDAARQVGSPPSAAASASGSAAVADDACTTGAGINGSNATVRVMLLDLKTAPWLAETAKGLGQIVAAEAAKVRGYSIISAEEVRAALDQEANKSMMGCDETSCLAELAQALDAELVISGRIDDTSEGNSLVSLNVLNARAIVVVNRVNMMWPGEAKRLPDVVRAAAQTLMFEPKDRPPGSVKLLGLPLGAQVFVDGAARGGADVIDKLAIGPHEIKVEAPDKTPWVDHAVVSSGAQSAVTVAMEGEPIDAVWLWLGGGAAVALGGAAAIGVAYALGQSDVVVQAAIPSVSANDVETIRGAK